jgi:FkbM family methyltransferase
MIVNTKRLFSKLLSKMEIGVVCDIGSMDGADALTFHDAAPGSTIYAFEPNPRNLAPMAADPALQLRGIRIVPMAVTNHDGEADFFLVDADYSAADYRRGMSSLYARPDDWAPVAIVPVKTTRLDTYLLDKCTATAKLALWIDTEGKAHEVIDGMSGIAQRVYLLHIEVETSPCISSDQKLFGDVKTLLQRTGFAEFATDQAHNKPQFNALFIRSDLPAAMQFQAYACLADAGLRHLLVRTARRVCPGLLRRYQTRRSRLS